MKLGQSQIPARPRFDNQNNLKVSPYFGLNWSRNRYDVGAEDYYTRQSTAPLEYILDPNYTEQCQPCRPASEGFISKQGVSYNTNSPIIDQESELFNLNRVLTRDPNYKYIPLCPDCGNCQSGLPCGDAMESQCSSCQSKLFDFQPCGIKHEYTRLSNPTCTLRETGHNRFQPLCLNPQDESRWLHPGEIGINWRMISKDNHVPCPPKPLDVTPSLPTPNKDGITCALTVPSCSANIANLNNQQLI